ncbi:response regulator [Dyadobacter tibetensis]|uniref:response regulator n=1 Tax=Dyadobacter tibetensis TaxID=1211851 RepID=UPI0004706DF1|nr:response regulator transcription factor [Dyadobacter tibetensis]
MKNILLVDDQPLTWIGMENLAKKVIADAAFYFAPTFPDALQLLSDTKMDLVMLDLNLPGGQGVEMISQLRGVQKDVRILICTGREESTNAPVFIQKGANGFVNKTASNDEVEEAIRMVLSDKRYVSPHVQRHILERFVDGKTYPLNPVEQLSPREKEIMELLLKGKWTKEISDILGIKFSTVSTHKSRIFEKMEVDNILELSKRVEMFEGAY